MKTKIFEFHINGEKEWLCADSFLEALKYYLSFTETDLDDIDEIIEIPKEKWTKINIIDVDSSENNVIETFYHYMKHSDSTEIIATTYY